LNVKYQVFVSSTYEDLRSEREQAVKAILEMGHIPIGMEMFSAADEQQWQIISRHVANSDYYVLIIAHRYGSMDGDRSYTEKEYDFAVECGVPVLGFVLEDTAAWPSTKMDSDAAKREALQRFKAKVKCRYISYWSTAADLYGKVSVALTKQMTASPRTGWVPADQATGPEVTAELARLSKQNAELQSQLKSALGAASQASAIWGDFIDRLYDYERAVAWYRASGKSPPATDNYHAKALELEKVMVKLQFVFGGTEHEALLQRAKTFTDRIDRGQLQPGELMLFARSLGTTVRQAPPTPKSPRSRKSAS
jgi:hypothetical protein